MKAVVMMEAFLLFAMSHAFASAAGPHFELFASDGSVREQDGPEVKFEWWTTPPLREGESLDYRVLVPVDKMGAPMAQGSAVIAGQKIEISFKLHPLRSPVRCIVAFLAAGGEIVSRQTVTVLPKGYLKQCLKDIGLNVVYERADSPAWTPFLRSLGVSIVKVVRWDDARITAGSWIICDVENENLALPGLPVCMLREAGEGFCAMMEPTGGGSWALSVPREDFENPERLSTQWNFVRDFGYVNLQYSKGKQ